MKLFTGEYIPLLAKEGRTRHQKNGPVPKRQSLPLPFTPPSDIYPDSRSRLPLIQTPPQTAAAVPALYSRGLAPEGTGPAHIRRHGTGLKSLEGSVGRRLMALAILVTAREPDSQYEWT